MMFIYRYDGTAIKISSFTLYRRSTHLDSPVISLNQLGACTEVSNHFQTLRVDLSTYSLEAIFHLSKFSHYINGVSFPCSLLNLGVLHNVNVDFSANGE